MFKHIVRRPHHAEPSVKLAPPKAFDTLDFCMRFEADGQPLTEDELIEGFQHLIDSGLAWQLQGVYGRTAADLIRQGLCHPRTGGAL